MKYTQRTVLELPRAGTCRGLAVVRGRDLSGPMRFDRRIGRVESVRMDRNDRRPRSVGHDQQRRNDDQNPTLEYV